MLEEDTIKNKLNISEKNQEEDLESSVEDQKEDHLDIWDVAELKKEKNYSVSEEEKVWDVKEFGEELDVMVFWESENSSDVVYGNSEEKDVEDLE